MERYILHFVLYCVIKIRGEYLLMCAHYDKNNQDGSWDKQKGLCLFVLNFSPFCFIPTYLILRQCDMS